MSWRDFFKPPGQRLSEMVMELTQLVPQPEPEVADRKRWPKPGSLAWVERYQTTVDHIEAGLAASPSCEERVQLAWVELAAAIREDLERGNAARRG